MRRVLAFVYGVICYVISLCAFLYRNSVTSHSGATSDSIWRVRTKCELIVITQKLLALRDFHDFFALLKNIHASRFSRREAGTPHAGLPYVLVCA